MPRSIAPRAVARVALAAAAVLLSTAAASRAADKDDVTAAVHKLADAKSYAYATTATGGFGGNSDGKVEKDGYTSVSMTLRDNTMKAVKKGDRAAVETDDGWKTAAELQGAEGPQRFMGMMVQNLRTPVAQAEQILEASPELKKGDDGTYAADLPEPAAKKLMTLGRGRRGGGGAAPQVSNAKASVTFTLAEGALSKMVVHTSGTITINGEDRDIDRTTTTEIKAVNATTADVPAEAKAKLDAAPATQP